MSIINKFIFLALVIFSFQVNSYERSSAFVIKLFSDRIKVTSPQKYVKNISAIIENKTLIKSYGKLITAQGRIITYFAVKSGGFASYNLNLKKNEHAYLVPLAPSFQEFELKFGSKAYEIPPKK